MTKLSKNKAIVHEYVEAMNTGNYAKLRAIFNPDVALYGVLGKGDLEFALPIWKQLHEALSMHLEVCEIIEEGDIVAVRFKETGKSVAPFGTMPATGKTFELTAIEWFCVKDGKIVSRYGVRDSASQAKQLGWVK